MPVGLVHRLGVQPGADGQPVGHMPAVIGLLRERIKKGERQQRRHLDACEAHIACDPRRQESERYPRRIEERFRSQGEASDVRDEGPPLILLVEYLRESGDALKGAVRRRAVSITLVPACAREDVDEHVVRTAIAHLLERRSLLRPARRVV